ncbi:hypothetical protein MBLNU457_g0243t1 [Dothideomycetes sp. NU457]
MNSTTTKLDTTQPERGTKRAADDSLDDEQRFTKRFNLLNLDHDISKLYIPVTGKPARDGPAVKPPRKTDQSEHMRVDDTKDRVYIYDLDDELADIESEEEKLIFLPDIEKKLSKIPKHVLTGKKDEEEGLELVLYGVPTSLTVPAEQDSVRRAIGEARQRARDKAAREAQPHMQNQPETAHGMTADDYAVEGADDDDPDAMDIG